MLKIGVVGVGHLGKIHLNCLKTIPSYQVVGFYDIDEKVTQEVASLYQLKAFSSLEALLEAADVIDIVTTTHSHYQVAKAALLAGKHLFIEKPATASLANAKELHRIALHNQLKIHVGQVERYNPAFLAFQQSPMPFQSMVFKRFAPYNERGMDVSVVMDLMIHDIDLARTMAQSEVIHIEASSQSSTNESLDDCYAMLHFKNGKKASLEVSRKANTPERYILLHTTDTTLKIDLLNKKITGNEKYTTLPIINSNPIQEELIAFHESVSNNTEKGINMSEVLATIDIASKIEATIASKKSLV